MNGAPREAFDKPAEAGVLPSRCLDAFDHVRPAEKGLPVAGPVIGRRIGRAECVWRRSRGCNHLGRRRYGPCRTYRHHRAWRERPHCLRLAIANVDPTDDARRTAPSPPPSRGQAIIRRSRGVPARRNAPSWRQMPEAVTVQQPPAGTTATEQPLRRLGWTRSRPQRCAPRCVRDDRSSRASVAPRGLPAHA